jgi:hypothetical protein
MNKIRAMNEHIAARRSIGVTVSFLDRLQGYFWMFFTVPKADIIEGTTNIRNGHVHYDPVKNVMFYKD